jgi:hypothetical protein
MATPASDWLRHFWLFFRKTTSFEVTRLTINIPPVFWRSVVPFVVIRNPKWLPSPLIDWNCFYFLSRKAACLVTRHPEMFFRGSNVIFLWRSSHGINYKFVYIHIIIWWVYIFSNFSRCRRGRDHMVVWFITTCAMSAYHH